VTHLGDVSTIHGLRYVVSSGQRWPDRLVWAAIILAATATGL